MVSIFTAVAAFCLVPAMSSAASAPELPRSSIDTGYRPAHGRTLHVRAGDDFQSALYRAQPGDVITLEAGATFVGPFTLPKKPGSAWITIRTSAPDSRLPPPGTRADPSYANVMPKIVVGRGVGGAIIAAPGAHHYRFIGIEILPRKDVFVYNLVLLGSDERSENQFPHHIIFDRCYLHGDPVAGGRRGIALNGSSLAVIDSYLSDFKEVGAEAQSLLGWNGPGPFKIVNNYLEGAGENVMFGGASTPTIANLVPSDIEIRRNHFYKPLSWKIGHPSYAGTPWTVKNLFELKNARRVLVEENLFEHNWAHAQSGFAIVLTVRNQDGGAPWSVVEDVTFRRNIVRHTGSGVVILGRDDNFPSQQAKRILVQDNLFEDISGAKWGGSGILFQLLNGSADVVIDHNTGLQDEHIVMADGAPHTGFVYRNNIAPHNRYGIFGSGTSAGNATLERYFPGAVIQKNIIAGGSGALYPRDNFFPVSLHKVGFVNPAAGDYRLADSSLPKKAGTDGRDLGANFAALSQALAARSHKPNQKQPVPSSLTAGPGQMKAESSRGQK